MDTFLTPYEKPPGFLMALVYRFTKAKLGKVVTPLKVVYARLPIGFTLFSNKISALDKKLTLPGETIMLVRECVAQYNVCEFCMDIGRSFVIAQQMSQAKFEALHDFEHAAVFEEKEKLLLRYVTQLISMRKADNPLFQELLKHYTERQLCEAMWVVGTEAYYNMVNLGLNIHSDMLCDISRKKSVRD